MLQPLLDVAAICNNGEAARSGLAWAGCGYAIGRRRRRRPRVGSQRAATATRCGGGREEKRSAPAYCPTFSEYMCVRWWMPSPGASGQLTAAEAYLAPPLWMAWVQRMRDSQPGRVLVDPGW